MNYAPTPHPQPIPTLTRKRAFVCLLLNVIVFPGLGTIVSRDLDQRRTGYLQFGFGALLIPLLLVVSTGGALLGGMDPEVVKAWLGNFVMILVLWNVLTGVRLFRKAWREAPRSS